ncbi:transcription initiation protein SPT3 homolog isoform X1 [Diadema setosum]|uniref:transcription initiation protein SPT3 homolog isoform X1 n=1 Tax=Diadema setosum TaxID=31175 RepID=UPI003B3A1D82
MKKMTKQKVKSKKSDKGKDASSTGSSHESKSNQSFPMSPSEGNTLSPPLHATKPPNRVHFISEIQSMMFALGDCKNPLYESAYIVEDIVHHQMLVLLQRAADICTLRGARFISIEDFIFLLRKDHSKLRRLFQFLNFKDTRNKIARQMSCEEEEGGITDEQKASQAKRRRLCQDILSSIDHTGELSVLLDSDEVDPIKLERQDRADQKARGMDLTAYKEYTEARQMNFIKKASKFKEWLDISHLEPKPNAFAMEIVGYLAYETVAQIMDLSLLVQRDMLASPCDPISKSMAPMCFSNISPLTTHPHTKFKSATTTPPSTPSQSPVPSSPKSPTDKMALPFLSSTNGSAGNSGGNLTTASNSNPSESSTQSQGESKSALSAAGTPKAKSKKKKKGNGSSLLALTQYRAIQPHHIMEAVRRYNDVIKPMAPFSKHVIQGRKPKLLVL